MKILMIDDNSDISSLFAEYLLLNNHECVVVNEGAKAVEYMTQEKFDRIVLDLTMPEFSGYDVLNEMKEKRNIEFLNIIVLTATNISKEKQEELIKMGVKKILKKPISLKKINEEILN